MISPTNQTVSGDHGAMSRRIFDLAKKQNEIAVFERFHRVAVLDHDGVVVNYSTRHQLRQRLYEFVDGWLSRFLCHVLFR